MKAIVFIVWVVTLATVVVLMAEPSNETVRWVCVMGGFFLVGTFVGQELDKGTDAE